MCVSQVKEQYSEGLEEAVRKFKELQAMVLEVLNEESQSSPAREWYMPESDYYFYSADKGKWWHEDYPPPLPF